MAIVIQKPVTPAGRVSWTEKEKDKIVSLFSNPSFTLPGHLLMLVSDQRRSCQVSRAAEVWDWLWFLRKQLQHLHVWSSLHPFSQTWMPSWLKSPLISLLYTEKGGKQGWRTAWRRIQEMLASPEVASYCSGRPDPALPVLRLPHRLGLRSEMNVPLPVSLNVPEWESCKHGTETNLRCVLEALHPPFPVSQRTNPKTKASREADGKLLPFSRGFCFCNL